MLMRKTRRTYVQPTSEVVRLHVTNQLLQASVQSPSNTVEDYNWNTVVEE